jgi:acylphosphatase
LKKSKKLPNNSASPRQVELIVTGHVQGVSFRLSVQRWSRDLAISGFVTNQPDGSVYILAQGLSSQLEQLIQKCYAGPERAKVNQVTTKFVPITRQYQSFSIKH